MDLFLARNWRTFQLTNPHRVHYFGWFNEGACWRWSKLLGNQSTLCSGEKVGSRCERSRRSSCRFALFKRSWKLIKGTFRFDRQNVLPRKEHWSWWYALDCMCELLIVLGKIAWVFQRSSTKGWLLMLNVIWCCRLLYHNWLISGSKKRRQ